MADTSAPDSSASGGANPDQVGGAGGFNPRALLRHAMRGDVAFGLGILAIIMMLLLPMPAWLLDIGLVISIALSVLVLMTALFIKTPLEFTAFPTVLLVATMLRLGLNIASTRLILSEGQNGPTAAGDVIAAFGGFIMQGNFVIGVIVFIILVLVNFIVITKGSGRIAEVAARFTLDAMPGKQMAIDADLSAGLITEDQARHRRADLEAESNFFGSMDGASKFVRGDAMAGILITAINLVAGMIIGVAQHGMGFGEAADAYSRLTIGDGLVSQIPALIISVAAGMLVSKAGVKEGADKALVSQLTGYPQALAMVSGVCGLAGLLPGMPLIPFALLAVGSGYAAYWFAKRKPQEASGAGGALAPPGAAGHVPAEGAAPEGGDAPKDPEPIANALAIDQLKIELGYGLLPLINEVDGHKITDQIVALRRQLAQELGFVMPSVRILDNLALGNDAYQIRVKEIEAGEGALKLRHLLAMDPAGGPVDLPGEGVQEPAFGLPARWIDDALREEATFRGYTVVDPATVLVTHLTEIIKDHMAELLGYEETEKLFSDLSDEMTTLLDATTPQHISRAGIQRVLQTLLKERISIRDLSAILEAIAEIAPTTKDLVQITEHVRARLARQICHAHRAPDGALPMVTLSPQWEQAFAEALIGEGGERQLAMAPSQLHEFIQAVNGAFDEAGRAGDVPVLLTSPMVRPYARSLMERFRPTAAVMSQNEIHPKAKLRQVGMV